MHGWVPKGILQKEKYEVNMKCIPVTYSLQGTLIPVCFKWIKEWKLLQSKVHIIFILAEENFKHLEILLIHYATA